MTMHRQRKSDEARLEEIERQQERQQEAARDARDAEDRLFWADFLANKIDRDA